VGPALLGWCLLVIEMRWGIGVFYLRGVGGSAEALSRGRDSMRGGRLMEGVKSRLIANLLER